MFKPDFIPQADWDLVLKYANHFSNEPYLIGSIGWHETHWFMIGAGPGGWGLGFGYWPGSPYKDKYKGIIAQLKGADKMLVAHYKRPITLDHTTDFAVNHWKSSAPRSWAKSVYSIYSNLQKGIIPIHTETEVQDLTERMIVMEYHIAFFNLIIEKLKEVFGNEQ